MKIIQSIQTWKGIEQTYFSHGMHNRLLCLNLKFIDKTYTSGCRRVHVYSIGERKIRQQFFGHAQTSERRRFIQFTFHIQNLRKLK